MDRYTGPIVVGMKMVKVAHYGRFIGDPIGTVVGVSAYTKEVHEDDDARHAYHPVDAPAEKRERVLAPGWAATGSGNCFSCATPAPHRFSQPAGPGRRTLHCEPCAEAAGAFAPPAPARACKAWCGTDLGGWEAAAAKLGAKGEKSWTFDKLSYCTTGCYDRGRAAEKAARAKPAEPKPAPKYSTGYASACADEAFGPPTTIKKPAPAEMAKREWKAPREMKNGVFNADAARVVFHETRNLQPGAREELLCNLIDERPRRNLPRTKYDAATDAHGKLSRLVESGVRADVRQDETRFEAGLRRGAK